MVNVITLQSAQHLQKLQRERRNRRGVAWIIYDSKKEALVISQKLHHAADFINQQLAEYERERVNVAGLYEAADSTENRLDGFHKFRYKIVRAPLGDAHYIFNAMRNASRVSSAIILTQAPHAYPLSEDS